MCKKILDVKPKKTRIPERQGTTGEGPADSCKDDKGNGAMLFSYEDRLRELGLLEEETTKRGSDQCT